jgi:hypothetical protein
LVKNEVKNTVIPYDQGITVFLIFKSYDCFRILVYLAVTDGRYVLDFETSTLMKQIYGCLVHRRNRILLSHIRKDLGRRLETIRCKKDMESGVQICTPIFAAAKERLAITAFFEENGK